MVGVQAKWFPNNIESNQVNQIRNSINTAIKVRPKLKKYIVCLPKDLASLTARNKNETNTEEARLNSLKEEIAKNHLNLELVFWDKHVLRGQLQESGNEGIKRFWFEKAELSQESLNRKFEIEKAGWLNERYIPELHLAGGAEWAVEEALFTPQARLGYIESVEEDLGKISLVTSLIDEFNGKVTGHQLNRDLTDIRNNLTAFEAALSSIKYSIKSGSHIVPKIDFEEGLSMGCQKGTRKRELWKPQQKFARETEPCIRKLTQGQSSSLVQ